MVEELGTFGAFRRRTAVSPQMATALEELGYRTLWVGGSPAGDLQEIEDLLDATTTLIVATGIVNIWQDAAEPVAASYHRIESRHPGRFLLGIGVGHPEATGARYSKPYTALVEYLDALDAAEVPTDRRVLAALGPKVLKLSADRSAGAHPYLVTPEHTRRARGILGDGVLLAPEQKVVLDSDPERGRMTGRPAVATPYLSLTNYTNNLRTLGFDDADFAAGGSDRLIDALIAHGDAQSVVAALTEHVDAGADHVSINLITEPGHDALEGYAELAKILFA
jgi:probable F420-dependent oxidoreductase